MNIEEIKKILPHREPMLLVEEVTVENNISVGKYTVKGTEFFLQGHFPGKPVVPGVILCEMMAQSSCLLADTGEEEGNFIPYFTGLNNVKMRRPVLPGDTVVFTCELIKQRSNFIFVKGKGEVEGKLAISGELSFAIVKGE